MLISKNCIIVVFNTIISFKLIVKYMCTCSVFYSDISLALGTELLRLLINYIEM